MTTDRCVRHQPPPPPAGPCGVCLAQAIERHIVRSTVFALLDAGYMLAVAPVSPDLPAPVPYSEYTTEYLPITCELDVTRSVVTSRVVLARMDEVHTRFVRFVFAGHPDASGEGYDVIDDFSAALGATLDTVIADADALSTKTVEARAAAVGGVPCA